MVRMEDGTSHCRLCAERWRLDLAVGSVFPMSLAELQRAWCQTLDGDLRTVPDHFLGHLCLVVLLARYAQLEEGLATLDHIRRIEGHNV